MALAYAAGAILIHLGAPLPVAPLLLPALFVPIPLWLRPSALPGLLAVALAGALSAGAHAFADRGDCRRSLADGASVLVRGRLPGPPVGGRGVLIVEDGLGSGCRGEVSIVVGTKGGVPPAGALLAMSGRWRASPGARSAAFAGVLRVEKWTPVPSARMAPLAGTRGKAAARLHRAFGARAPLASALVLARREGLDPELKEAFARSGIAHLLSISGFHVAVVAGLLVAVLRTARAPRNAALLGAIGGVWGYVLLIGAPDAAVRAAILFSLLILARWRGRPLATEGALAFAFLLLAVLDPGGPGRPGFQLSFAGAAGLIRFASPLDERLRLSFPRLSPGIRGALSAGVGATLATMPVVVWHFERISLVGIPGTMVAGPLVALAIPGVLLVLLTAPLSESLAGLLAGGTDLVLAVLVAVVEAGARPGWASVGVSRGWVLAAAVGIGSAALSLVAVTGVGRRVRRVVLAAGALAAVVMAPVAKAVADRGTVAIEMLDVGQGDAILIRSPARRWVLVDAGPRSEQWDAGLRRVLPALRRRGVRRLEALVLTHPHLDHVGGAAAVLRGVRVGLVLDPGLPQGSVAFIEALEAAAERNTPWSLTGASTILQLDGMELEVLRPEGSWVGPDVDPNDVSVVLVLRHGAFSALLTGDAPRELEEEIAGAAGPVHLLKVAHHGSSTSSSAAFLSQIQPALALVSAGRGNRYGHPTLQVIKRLQEAGARVLRTDLNGEVDVRAREDGSWTVSLQRDPN